MKSLILVTTLMFVGVISNATIIGMDSSIYKTQYLGSDESTRELYKKSLAEKFDIFSDEIDYLGDELMVSIEMVGSTYEEENNRYVVEYSVPRLKEGSVDIVITGTNLMVSGSRMVNIKDVPGKFLKKFKRVDSFPDFNYSKIISHEYDDSVLRIFLKP